MTVTTEATEYVGVSARERPRCRTSAISHINIQHSPLSSNAKSCNLSFHEEKEKQSFDSTEKRGRWDPGKEEASELRESLRVFCFY